MLYRQDLHDLIAPAVAIEGCELLGVEFLSQGKHSLLRVYIDKPEGITIDDCEKAGRQISAVLDVEDPISSEYNLEVSSPGMDRPLFSAAHFVQAQGKDVRIMLQTPVNGQRKFRGVIDAVSDDKVLLQTEKELVELSLAEIAKANLVPQFDQAKGK